MNTSIFENEVNLPDATLSVREKRLLGFEERYAQVRNMLALMLNLEKLRAWNKEHFGGQLALCELLTDQCPLIIYHGDVGTGKTVTAECISNRLIAESKIEDCVLFKLGNRVRGAGKVGEMGSLLVAAFEEVEKSAGKRRRAVLIIDEGDSLAANRSQPHSHHEDRVAVNTLIQRIDRLRSFHGRVAVFLCTNRLAALDPAIRRRAAVTDEFNRPSDDERRRLFSKDLAPLGLSEDELDKLVLATGSQGQQPPWTYSDIRIRLYPVALAKSFPQRALCFTDLHDAVKGLKPSPIMEDMQ